jgi:peptidoglycan/LPS O-acetylase OafA/YrhL
LKSSDGHHWIALDHVRAVAAFLVFSWHFLHGVAGKPIPFHIAPAIFPLAILDEGHVGVALFMTLSGYLFAKLLAGKDILYGRFFWNRFIRLAPLLVFVMIVYPILKVHQFATFSVHDYLHDLINGFVGWRWPNGGWSITTEMHFYILLPLILILARQWVLAPLGFLFVAAVLRTLIFYEYGTVQDLAYYTIIGRIDQFVLGIMAFQARDFVRGRHWLTAVFSVAFMALYWWFDFAGGFFAFGGKYPSPSSIWIWLPTVQGAIFAWVIAYYDASFTPSTTGISRVIGRIGTYSYSIYLLHMFFVFRLPPMIAHRFIALANFYVACATSFVCFCGMGMIGWASYNVIEKPFLRLRVRYVRPAASNFGELAPSRAN